MRDYYHKHMNTTLDDSMEMIYNQYLMISSRDNYRKTLNISASIYWEFIEKWVIYHYKDNLIYEKVDTQPTQKWFGVFMKNQELSPTKISANGVSTPISKVVTDIISTSILPIHDSQVKIQTYSMPYCVQFIVHDVDDNYRGGI